MPKKKSNTPLIAGIAGGCLLLCICGGVIALVIGMSGDSDDASTSIIGLNMLMDGGSSAWDEAVKVVMLDAFDSNSSGAINTAAEVGKVDCATWKALDAGVKEQYEYGLRPIYGFEAGYSWVGYAIGFDEGIRPQADASLAASSWP